MIEARPKGVHAAHAALIWNAMLSAAPAPQPVQGEAVPIRYEDEWPSDPCDAHLPAPAMGDGMLPEALWPVSDEWYVLCERRFAVDKIKISGDLARAIVDAISATPAVQIAAPGDVEQRAREILAEVNGQVFAHASHLYVTYDAAIRAISAALRSQGQETALRNLPDGASLQDYLDQLCAGNLTPVDQMALDQKLHERSQGQAVANTEWIVSCGSGTAPALRFDNEPAAFARWAEEVSIPSYIRSGQMRRASVTKVTTFSEDRTAAALVQQANKEQQKDGA
jgi:hypothetical protein